MIEYYLKFTFCTHFCKDWRAGILAYVNNCLVTQINFFFKLIVLWCINPKRGFHSFDSFWLCWFQYLESLNLCWRSIFIFNLEWNVICILLFFKPEIDNQHLLINRLRPILRKLQSNLIPTLVIFKAFAFSKAANFIESSYEHFNFIIIFDSWQTISQNNIWHNLPRS